MYESVLPVAIIGAGPVGLAAAAHALARGLTPLVLEAGQGVGAGVLTWAHVRMFSPWRFNVDDAAAAILAKHGWTRPDDEAFPTGRDLVERYLEPLARTADLAPHIRLRTRVVGVARRGHDLMTNGQRAEAPYLVRVKTGGHEGSEGTVGPASPRPGSHTPGTEDIRHTGADDGGCEEADILAQAVIDASGTTASPGWLGASGLPAIGERALADRIFYGIPDVRGIHRARYAGRSVLVVGSGHSALNAILDLVTLADKEPATRVAWAIRRPVLGQLLGGARNDQLEERGRLGRRVRALLDSGRLELSTDFHLDRLTRTPDGVVVSSGTRSLAPVDEIVAATGFRPDWSILKEVRLDLDAAVESPRALAPLIDPNVHSCGTVRPHGADELKHPDGNLFAIGMKSYGRAPTFLLRTGYEQARSVVSAVAGDWDAARRVELVLPDTGVCSTDRETREPLSNCGRSAPPFGPAAAIPHVRRCAEVAVVDTPADEAPQPVSRP